MHTKSLYWNNPISIFVEVKLINIVNIIGMVKQLILLLMLMLIVSISQANSSISFQEVGVVHRTKIDNTEYVLDYRGTQIFVSKLNKVELWINRDIVSIDHSKKELSSYDLFFSTNKKSKCKQREPETVLFLAKTNYNTSRKKKKNN